MCIRDRLKELKAAALRGAAAEQKVKELKYSLTRQIWNKFTSTIKEPQMQGILQGLPLIHI